MCELASPARAPGDLRKRHAGSPALSVGDGGSCCMRRARLDFGAEIAWLGAREAPADGAHWVALDPNHRVPGWIREWVDPAGVGSLWQIGRSGPHSSALARVDYDDGRVTCWLLMLNASRPGDMPLDLRSYAAGNAGFPHDSTIDQFFTDEQWESYRRLGEFTAAAAIRVPDEKSGIARLSEALKISTARGGADFFLGALYGLECWSVEAVGLVPFQDLVVHSLHIAAESTLVVTPQRARSGPPDTLVAAGAAIRHVLAIAQQVRASRDSRAGRAPSTPCRSCPSSNASSIRVFS